MDADERIATLTLLVEGLDARLTAFRQAVRPHLPRQGKPCEPKGRWVLDGETGITLCGHPSCALLRDLQDAGF